MVVKQMGGPWLEHQREILTMLEPYSHETKMRILKSVMLLCEADQQVMGTTATVVLSEPSIKLDGEPKYGSSGCAQLIYEAIERSKKGFAWQADDIRKRPMTQ